jgi:hypothetical protein
MLNSMQSAGWALVAAAAVHSGVPLRRAGGTKFVFESYVAMKMSPLLTMARNSHPGSRAGANGMVGPERTL